MNRFIRSVAVVSATALCAGLLSVVAVTVVAEPAFAGITSGACVFADSETATECVISSAWTQGGGGVGLNQFSGVGPFVFKKTVHITGVGSITSPVVGITLNIDGTLTGGMPTDDCPANPPATDPYCNATGGPGHLLMDSGAAVIQAPGPGDFSGGPITIMTSGNVIMQAGTLISTENAVEDGNGGPVVLDVNGDKMVMCGPAVNVAFDAACSTSAAAGAKIITDANGVPGTAGDITIMVGDYPNNPVGKFLMDFGTFIQANAPSGAGGVIYISAGHSAVVNGNVLSQVLSGQTGSGNAANQGFDGKMITIETGCGLDVGGFISSFGKDAGADLVHLESCEVIIRNGAIVESSGAGNDPGHAPPGTNNENHCGSPFRPDKPTQAVQGNPAANLSACVEIWGKVVKIESGGQVRTTPIGEAWIDIFGEEKVSIAGPGDGAFFAVHVNDDNFGGVGGLITIKVKNGPFQGMGKVAQASTASPPGGSGGVILVEVKGLATPCCDADPPITGIVLGDSVVDSSESSTQFVGGSISMRSYQAGITGNAPGMLDNTGGGAPTLRACNPPGIAYTGASTPAFVPTLDPAPCSGEPTFESYVQFNENGIWDKCSSISGIKFEDLNTLGQKDLGDPPLQGWTINLYKSPDFVVPFATTVTDVNGFYQFLGPRAGPVSGV